MKTAVRLCWTADHSRIVPKGHADAAELFAREGAEVSAEIVAQYGLEKYNEFATGGLLVATNLDAVVGDGSGEALPPIDDVHDEPLSKQFMPRKRKD